MAAAKVAAKMMAGQQLGKFFDSISKAAGVAANEGTQALLKAGTGRFMPNVGASELPRILRASSTSLLPKAAEGAARLGVAGLGLYGADAIFDQQSAYTQPMPKGVGDKDMANFLYSQQLQNQKFMHDMQLVSARAESRIPGAQYPGSLMNMTQRSDILRDRAEAERLYSEAGEITNREVQGIARSIYGTGLRA